MTNTQPIELPDAPTPTPETPELLENWEAQLPKPTGYRLLIALPDIEEYYKGSTLLKTPDAMHKEYIMSGVFSRVLPL